jgi:cysteine-S-conjugate beta-lyase
MYISGGPGSLSTALQEASGMRRETELVHFEAAPGDPVRPTSTPIYQTATFRQPTATGFGAYDYTRSGNPTRSVLEAQLARLECGARALTFASGMAAVAAVASLVSSGEEILAGDDLYGGTCRYLSRVLPQQGIAVRYVDTTDLAAVAEALARPARLVLIETPTNPLQKISDLAALARIVHAAGALLAVDNSLLSPYLQQPLELGADLVIHSATKFLCGHSDVTAGAVVCRDAELGERLAFYCNAVGAALAPFEAWLLLRGLRSLALRLDRQQANAKVVAHFLAGHPQVRRVHYPGLPGHPGREILLRQARGPGALVSFETGDPEVARRVAEATELFNLNISFGGMGSSVSLPARMSHASIPPEVRHARPLVPDDLVRLSVGIEHAEDLVADLAQAFARAVAIEPAEPLPAGAGAAV